MFDYIKVPQIRIKRATIQDASDWASILQQSLKETYGKCDSIENLESDFFRDVNMVNSSTELYMLKIDGNSVGILKIGQPIKYYSDGHNYYKDNIDDVGEIKSLHVKKDFQGKGIGTQAIIFAENRLRELDYNESSIWVKMQNTNAINFYIKCGYSKTDYINPNTNDKLPSMVMEKKLRILVKDRKNKDNSTLSL